MGQIHGIIACNLTINMESSRMLVSEIMTKGVKTANEDTSVRVIANVMCLNNISGLPIIDSDNNIVGIVSEKDLLRKMFPDMQEIADEGRPDFEDMEKKYADALDLTAKDIMTSPVSSVTSDMPIMKAASLMCINTIRRIPVVDDGKVVGIVSIGDVHKAIFQNTLAM